MPCVRGGRFRAVYLVRGVSCLSRSSNHTNEIDQRDQMNQIPTTRREMGPVAIYFPHPFVSNRTVDLALLRRQKQHFLALVEIPGGH